MPAGRLLRTKISAPASGDFTITSSVTSCGVCAEALVAIAITANRARNALVIDSSFVIGPIQELLHGLEPRQFPNDSRHVHSPSSSRSSTLGNTPYRGRV